MAKKFLILKFKWKRFIWTDLERPTRLYYELILVKLVFKESVTIFFSLQDLPTFTWNLTRFISDLRYYKLCNASLPAGSVSLSMWYVLSIFLHIDIWNKYMYLNESYVLTDKRTDVWSCDFMIWKINFGLLAVGLGWTVE